MTNQTFSIKILLFLSFLLAFASCGDKEVLEPDTNELKAPTSLTISNIGRNAFRVDWTSVTGAEGYEATVARDNAFTDLVQPYVDLRENGTGISVIGLDPSTTYFVRVRTIIDGEKSAYSSTETGTTLDPTGAEPGDALKEAATTFSVGMAVRANNINGQYDAIYKREYNSLTAEYEIKMNIMYPSQGSYNFSRADAIVNYAQENGMHVHGHALIWHSATPTWVENFTGTDEEFEAMVEDYIKTTVTRYIGKVRSWV